MKEYADEMMIKVKNFVTKTDMAMGKVRENLDELNLNMNTYKFDIDKLMSTSTKLTEGVERQEIEITQLQKDRAVL